MGRCKKRSSRPVCVAVEFGADVSGFRDSSQLSSDTYCALAFNRCAHRSQSVKPLGPCPTSCDPHLQLHLRQLLRTVHSREPRYLRQRRVIGAITRSEISRPIKSCRIQIIRTKAAYTAPPGIDVVPAQQARIHHPVRSGNLHQFVWLAQVDNHSITMAMTMKTLSVRPAARQTVRFFLRADSTCPQLLKCCHIWQLT